MQRRGCQQNGQVGGTTLYAGGNEQGLWKLAPDGKNGTS